MNLCPDEIHLAKKYYEFFAKIPAEKWCKRILVDNLGRKCAMGHLGATPQIPKLSGDEKKIVSLIFRFTKRGIPSINDNGLHDAKTNILNRLKEIITYGLKDGQNGNENL